MMADDPMLREEAEQGVRDGLDAAHALDAAFDRHRRGAGGARRLPGRAGRRPGRPQHRAVADALGVPMPGLPVAGAPVRAGRRGPLPRRHGGPGPADVLALVTEKGGPTSHTAILARGRGLPAVVALRGRHRHCRTVRTSPSTVSAARSPSASPWRRPRASWRRRAGSGASAGRDQRAGQDRRRPPGQAAAQHRLGRRPAAGRGGRRPVPDGVPLPGPQAGAVVRGAGGRLRRGVRGQAGSRSSCAPWTRAPTSRCRSSACRRAQPGARHPRPAGGPRRCRRCWTPSSTPSPRRPARPAPTSWVMAPMVTTARRGRRLRPPRPRPGHRPGRA